MLALLLLGTPLFVFYKSNIYHRCKRCKDLLQPSRLLERPRSHKKVSPGSKSFWRCCEKVVDQSSPMANIPSSSKAHSLPQIWFVHPECTSPSRPSLFTTTTKSVVRVKIVHIAGYFKEAEPLTLKDSALVTSTFQKIYKWGPLKRPQLLQVHPMGKHNKRLTGTLRFTWTRKSLKDLSAPLLSCISPNSVCFGALNSFFVHLSFLMLHEITVIAQCDSTNVLKLQLEQPWLLHAPFVPCQPFFFPNSSATSGCTASSI